MKKKAKQAKKKKTLKNCLLTARHMDFTLLTPFKAEIFIVSFFARCTNKSICDFWASEHLIYTRHAELDPFYSVFLKAVLQNIQNNMKNTLFPFTT